MSDRGRERGWRKEQNEIKRRGANRRALSVRSNPSSLSGEKLQLS